MKLYGIGTGPGATDLLTLRAVNSIKDSSIIFAPNNRGKNMAVDTCEEFIEEKKVNLIDFPMGEVTREDYKNAAKTIYEDLKKYKVGSFLTIGDSMIYSTFIYIAQELMEIDNTVEIEIVPGIPSFVASAARAQVQLTEKSENFLLCDEFDEKALEIADSIAILKTFKNKEEILEGLERNNFSYNYIKKVSLPEEEIFDETRKDEILNDKNYMSLILGRKKIRGETIMLHGGDTLSYEKYYDGELLDFSSNINPLGVPKGLEEELIKGFKTLTSYPDIKYRELKTSIKNYLNCDYENVVVGNGAMEVIDSFIMLSERVITTTPAFAEYSLRAEVHKKEVVKLEYKDDFSVDIEKLKDTIKERDTLVLGNPNNPTGLRIPKDTLLEIYKIVVDNNAFLVLDEAFFEFAPKDYDSIELFKENDYKNIGIIRAATKFFALPGIRLGYGCTSKELVKEIEFNQMPWSINSLADIAGQYIFKNTEYILESSKYINEQREYLLENLEKYDWIKVYKTHTNYILIKLNQYDEDYIFDYFVRKGIVIRKCSSFKVLGKNHIRVAIKDKNSNDKLLRVFDEFEKEEIK